MSPELLLRIASVAMLLHVLGHVSGHLRWKKTKDPAKQEAINRMTQQKFPFMGTRRSLGEFYDGYGYAATLAMLFVCILLWSLSGQTLANPNFTRGLLPLVSVFLLAWGIDEVFFFFPFAAFFSLFAALLSAIAFFAI